MLKNNIKDVCEDKHTIGIGTGRTVESILQYLNPSSTYVSSSHQTSISLTNLSLKSVPIETVQRLDLYIDGCDYFDREGNMIKGKGGSLTTEKLLCSMADEVVIVVQDYKYRKRFNNCYVPIEILPQSIKYIENILIKNGIKYELRCSKNKFGPVITDLGNFIIDIVYDREFLIRSKQICGVVEHGYFENKDYNIKVEVFKE